MQRTPRHVGDVVASTPGFGVGISDLDAGLGVLSNRDGAEGAEVEPLETGEGGPVEFRWEWFPMGD